MAGLIGSHSDFQGTGVGQSDIFAGKPGQASGDVKGVFSCFQHPGQPVNCGIRVRISHGFVQGGDQIVVFLSIFVVEKGLLGGALFQGLSGYCNGIVGDRSVEDHHFQGG